ncbi:MAG: hypothetical protein WCJ58_01965 [bacterium]
MIKKLIEPLQKVLMQKKICPACTRPFSKAKVLENRLNGTDIVQCDCSRIFIFNREINSFRRALSEEVTKFL